MTNTPYARRSTDELRALFQTAACPDLADVSGRLQAELAGPLVARLIAPHAFRLTGLGDWWGKELHPTVSGDALEGFNLSGPNGQETTLPLSAKIAPSLLDGKPAVVLTYPKEARFPWSRVVDDVRILPDGTILGMTFGLPLTSGGNPFILRKHAPNRYSLLPKEATMSTSLNGRTVAITGAARGIGLAIAKALLAGGAQVAISDIDDAALEVAARETGVTCYAKLDVTDPTAFAGFLTKVEQDLGPLDALVNNAGIMPTGPLLDESDPITRRIVEIDTLGVIWGTKKALELMVPRGRGHIVNIASTMGETPVPGLATYNGAKAAAIMFTDAARLEFRESGVKFSVVLPNGVNTGLADGVDATLSLPIPGTAKSIPLTKHVEPEDIAAAVVEALASGKSHPRVYAPRNFGLLLESSKLLPRSVSEKLKRVMGAESKILTDLDPAARVAYQQRVAHS